MWTAHPRTRSRTRQPRALTSRRRPNEGKRMATVGFWQSAIEDPERIVLHEPDGTTLTAGELLSNANRLVHGLRALGLKAGDGIACTVPNVREMFELFFAAT